MGKHAVLREDLGQRRFDLDWVRIGAFMLLIFYHVGMYYVTWDFHVKSRHASARIEPLMMLSSPWRLSLLFLVSGVASAYLLARGGDRFLRSRSVRLLLPLAFGMLVIVPPQSYLQVVEKLGYSGTYIEFWRLYVTGFHGFCAGSDCLILPTWNHLWFVAYLWVYTVVLYGVLRLLPRSIARLRAIAERSMAGPGVLLLPIACLAAMRILLLDRFPQTHALFDDWYSHAVYLFAFLLGFILAGTKAPWLRLQHYRWYCLGLAVLGWAVLCGYLGAYADSEPPSWMIYCGRTLYGSEQWLAIAAILGFARRHLQRDNAARRYLTQAIFPVYILHQTVIIVAAHALKPADLYPPVEGLLLIMVTAAVSFLGYELIRRIGPLRPLFGLTHEAAGAPALGARALSQPMLFQDLH